MEQRKKRQKELARVFYEMGMDVNLVEKISGLSKEEVSEIVDNKQSTPYNSDDKNKNDSY